MADAAKSPRTRLISALLVVALLVGVGLYVRHRLRAPAVDHAVNLVPFDADAYLHVFLKPSTSQRRALQSLLERFPATDDEDEAEGFIDDLLRDVLGRFDIEVGSGAGEWLGDEAAVFLPSDSTSPTLLLAVEDEEEANAALKTALEGRIGEEIEISFIDGFAVVGEPTSVDQVEVSGRSLADEERFHDLGGRLEDHRLALLYLDELEPLPSESVVLARLGFDESPAPIASVLRVVDEGFVLDMTAKTDADVERLLDALRAVTAELPGMEALERIGAIETGGLKTGLLEGFEPVLAVDASALPTIARTALLAAVDEELGPLLAQVLTIELGVRQSGEHMSARLAVTFSDA